MLGKRVKHAVVPLLLVFWATHLTAQSGVSDPKASPRTKALFDNLQSMSGRQILFGHQDDLAYGVSWKGEPNRSDIHDVYGAYPSVFGWDLGELGKNARYNIDSVPFAMMRKYMRKAYAMGSINTLSWHVDNPRTGGDAWDTTTVVRDLLPGGPLHGKLREQLDGVADYLKGLTNRGVLGHKIPVIFRPWHENTGNWFWWGSAGCTPEEFISLWRFTVDYLRKERNIKHLLYAFSPSSNYTSAEEYLRTYPGDEYVDILGLDYYFHPYNLQESRQVLSDRLALISRIARERGKISALTETGYETIPDSAWWTQMLLPILENNPESGRIAYLLVWRNAWSGQRANHYYAPYPGHPSAADFIRFARHPRVALNDRMPDMYKRNKRESTPIGGSTDDSSPAEGRN